MNLVWVQVAWFALVIIAAVFVLARKYIGHK
jgi:hypothetical protein